MAVRGSRACNKKMKKRIVELYRLRPPFVLSCSRSVSRISICLTWIVIEGASLYYWTADRGGAPSQRCRTMHCEQRKGENERSQGKGEGDRDGY